MRDRIGEPALIFVHSLGGIVGIMVAAQGPDRARALVVGDAPLTGGTWKEGMAATRAKLIAWRALAGGDRPIEEVIASLEDAAVFDEPGHSGPARMRDVYPVGSLVYRWVAENLACNDPDMLAALVDDIDTTAAGYDMDRLLPAIQCPVLLMQADPARGGITDAEVARAMTLLREPTHVVIENVGHILYNERKEPVLAALMPFLDAH